MHSRESFASSIICRVIQLQCTQVVFKLNKSKEKNQFFNVNELLKILIWINEIYIWHLLIKFAIFTHQWINHFHWAMSIEFSNFQLNWTDKIVFNMEKKQERKINKTRIICIPSWNETAIITTITAIAKNPFRAIVNKFFLLLFFCFIYYNYINSFGTLCIHWNKYFCLFSQINCTAEYFSDEKNTNFNLYFTRFTRYFCLIFFFFLNKFSNLFIQRI